MTCDCETRVERLKESDLDEVLSIERASFASPWTYEMFAAEIGNRNSYSVTFRKGPIMIGYLCLWEVLDEAHILNICVHPEYRGHGYGLMIMDHIAEVCAKDSIKRIILEVGRRNRVARNLYQRTGFVTIGFRKGYYQDINDDALVMEKRLDEDPDQEAGNGSDSVCDATDTDAPPRK
jgi:[ribosomal protein S18]-alanine N-acetyltransferase